MDNMSLAKLLRDVAASYAIKDEKKYKFQIIAYQRAADSVEHANAELKTLWKTHQLQTVQGIGPSMAQHLSELFETGKAKHFESVMHGIPPSVFPLLSIPSFGPKRAYRFVTELKLTNPKTVIDDLEKKAQAGEVAKLEGFGEKSQEDVLSAIREYHGGAVKATRMALPIAAKLADDILEYMKGCPGIEQIYPLGSLRRQNATIGDVDIAVASSDPDTVLTYFTKYPFTERVLEKGPASSSILVGGGKHVDLMVQPPDAFGSLLQHFTGSKSHNIKLREYALDKGMSLSEYGIRPKGEGNDSPRIKKFAKEEDFYHALGLDWVPPEIREDTGEIELAIKHKLPKLVELTDIKGEFHLHSSFPIEPSHDMGTSSMEVMLEKGRSFGYKYMGFSEHNPSISKHTEKEVCALLEKKKNHIEQINSSNKDIRVYNMIECDILPSGELALPASAIDFLDAMIVSIHSNFDTEKKEMTERVLKGLSHPKAKILAHPTGRMINSRPGYELNWIEIFDFCVKNNKALEINAWPYRLDLPDVLVRDAIRAGVKLVIDTDSHQVDQMEMMRFGVSVARRGWATAHDILNTYPTHELEKWLLS